MKFGRDLLKSSRKRFFYRFVRTYRALFIQVDISNVRGEPGFLRVNLSVSLNRTFAAVQSIWTMGSERAFAAAAQTPLPKTPAPPKCPAASHRGIRSLIDAFVRDGGWFLTINPARGGKDRDLLELSMGPTPDRLNPVTFEDFYVWPLKAKQN